MFRTYHTACWKKTAKGQTQANSKLTSGPKYCGGDSTTPQPGGETDSMRVMSYNLYGWNALVQNPWKAENVYKAIRQINPDLLGGRIRLSCAAAASPLQRSFVGKGSTLNARKLPTQR